MLAEDTPKLSDADVLKEVQWRFRICSYLFRVGALWIFIGGLLLFALSRGDEQLSMIGLTVQLVGAGVFTAAFAMTLAIYRCPVCDRYLSRFRPDKRLCPRCGATVRKLD